MKFFITIEMFLLFLYIPQFVCFAFYYICLICFFIVSFRYTFMAAGKGDGVALRRLDILQPFLFRRTDATAGNVQSLCQLDRFQTALDPHLFYLCHTRS